MKKFLSGVFTVFAGIMLTSCFGTDDVQPGVEQIFVRETAIIDEYLQDNNITAEVDPFSLLRYETLSEGTGLAPYSGSFGLESVNIDYITTLLQTGDTVEVAENVDVDWDNLILGLQVGLRNVRESGRMAIYIPSVIAYGEQGQGDIPGNAILIYDITLNSFENPQLKNEVSFIQNFINTEGIPAVRHPSGLFYQITDQGDGPAPRWGSNVFVNYTGRLLETGDQFDQGQGASFNLSQLILGWQIGLQQMNQGGVARFFIPSSLGYGPDGSGSAIPPNATLDFTVELNSVTN